MAPAGWLYRAAMTAVPGVVAARKRGSTADGQVVIHGYLEDANARGISSEVAWAMLFSASVVWIDALLGSYGVHHNQDPLEALQEIAADMAEQMSRDDPQ